MIAFFHQNEVAGVQGGIERYLSTLLRCVSHPLVLVTEESAAPPQPRIAIPVSSWAPLPKWLRYAMSVVANARRIRSELRARGASVLEFSRPEYALFSWLFPGKKVFTIHGTGPNPEDKLEWLAHNLSCWLLPLAADGIQVIGRDNSALPRPVRALLAERIVQIDAWYDDRFEPRPFPPLNDVDPLVVCYSGRLSKQKYPELMFEIMRRAAAEIGFPIQFRYFGADDALLQKAGMSNIVVSDGLLGPTQLVDAICRCHAGILCSKNGEGSPFAMIEALACGRAFIASPLPTLVDAYRGIDGVFFADRLDVDAFFKGLRQAREYLLGGAAPTTIAEGVKNRSQNVAAEVVVRRLQALANDPGAFRSSSAALGKASAPIA